MVSRAFTAYQLDSLVRDIWQFCNEFNPVMLIINGITDLLFDNDVPRDDAEDMLDIWISEINKQTHSHNIISIITSRYYKTCFSQYMTPYSDKAVCFTRQKKGIKIRLPAKQKTLVYMPTLPYQYTIDEFIEVDANG